MALNIQPTRNNKGGHTRWQPGKSGNPAGGKPRYEGPTLGELCKAQTLDAVKTLITIMHFKGPNQLQAAMAILDRGWGKPTQTIETTGDSAHALHLLAAQAISASLLEAQQSAGQTVVDTTPEEQQRLLSADPPTE